MKYVRTKINGKKSVIINQSDYTSFYNARLLEDGLYYNRNIPIVASLI